MVFRLISKWYKPKNVKKLALDSQLLTVQILANDVQVLILCLFYFITVRTFMIHIYKEKDMKIIGIECVDSRLYHGR